MRYLKGLSTLVDKIYLQKDCHYKLSSYELNYSLEDKSLSLIHYGKEILNLKQLGNNESSNKNIFSIANLYFQSQSDLNAINTVIAAWAHHTYGKIIDENSDDVAEYAYMYKELAVKQGKPYWKIH